MSLGVAHRCRKPECGWLMEGYAGADARLARSRESIARRSQWHEVAVYPPLNGGDLLIGSREENGQQGCFDRIDDRCVVAHVVGYVVRTRTPCPRSRSVPERTPDTLA